MPSTAQSPLPAGVAGSPGTAPAEAATAMALSCGVAYAEEHTGDLLSTAIYCEGALPPPPSFPCMNQEGNSVGFGTPLTLKSFPQNSSVIMIQDKLEMNPCHNCIGSADLNRTLPTMAKGLLT